MCILGLRVFFLLFKCQKRQKKRKHFFFPNCFKYPSCVCRLHHPQTFTLFLVQCIFFAASSWMYAALLLVCFLSSYCKLLMICCKLSYTWWLLLIPDNHHLAAVWLCTYVWFVCGFGSACAQLTDGTVCNELLCDNYGACWGKWKKSADEFGTVCVCV